jgi:hypothetical protein
MVGDAGFPQILFLPPDDQVLTRVLTIVSSLSGGAPPSEKQREAVEERELRFPP